MAIVAKTFETGHLRPVTGCDDWRQRHLMIIRHVTSDIKWHLTWIFRHSSTDIWCQREFSDICCQTFNSHLNFRHLLLDIWRLFEFSDICRSTFDAHSCSGYCNATLIWTVDLVSGDHEGYPLWCSGEFTEVHLRSFRHPWSPTRSGGSLTRKLCIESHQCCSWNPWIYFFIVITLHKTYTEN